MANVALDPGPKPDAPTPAISEPDQPIHMRDTNGRINWATMQLQADTGDTAYIPDFVDVSKISYLSQMAGPSRRGSRDWRVLDQSEESLGVGMSGSGGRGGLVREGEGREGEGRDSLCDLEEMLCRGPNLPSSGGSSRGKSRERRGSKLSPSPRASSSTTPVKETITV